jgi:ABC-2 type transport system permease protein
MRSLCAVCKRELKAYFTSPIAYVMMGGLLVVVGYLYYTAFRWFLQMSFEAMRNPMMASELDLGSMVVVESLRTLGIISVFTLPLLTMRLWAEEKRTGTVELLLTFPLRDSEVVLGKFFACLLLYVVLLVLSLVYPLLAAWLSTPDVGPIASGYLGTVLMGASLIALGFLCSTWTENQIVACVLAWSAFLLFWLIGHAADIIKGPLGALCNRLSFAKHYENFVKGVIETQDIVFFVIFTLGCLFLTLRSIESTRWRG